MSYKIFEKRAHDQGKQLFIESYHISLTGSDVVLEEVNLLTESKNIKYEAFAILKNVPVTGFELNKNNRKYPKSLFERIIQEKSAEGNLCLADHPSDSDADGSVTRISGVWHNFRLGERNGFADLYLVGSYGRLILETLKAGGKIGFSTVGYGELQEDKQTVDPYSYSLERLSDAVLTPSQSVYATRDHVFESKSTQIAETSSTNKNNMESSRLTESEMSLDALTKYQEANFRSQVRALLKEAKSAQDSRDIKKMSEVLVELKENAELIPLDESKKVLISAHSQLETALKEEVEAMEADKEDTEAKYEELQKKYKAAADLSESLRTNYKKALEIIEKLGGSATNPQKLQMVEDMQDDIKKFLEDRKNMQADLNILMSERELMLADIKQFIKERKLMLSDISKLIEDTKKRDMDIAQFISDRGVMTEDIGQLLRDRKAMKEDLKRLMSERKLMERDIKLMEKKISEADIGSGYGEIGTPKTGWPYETEDEMQSISIDPAIDNRMSEPEGTYRIENTEKKAGGKKLTESSKNRKGFTESYRGTNLSSELKVYYTDKVAKYPSIARIKDKLLSAKSFLEAVNLVEAYISEDTERPVKIKESAGFTAQSGSWMDGYL